jgi:F-type H+-transporting ATPase subunit epsilon
MNISILLPEKELYSGEIISVKVPGTSGQFQVLKKHAPIVSSLGKGTVYIVKSDGSKMNFQITSGYIEVLNNQVSLLVQGVKE